MFEEYFGGEEPNGMLGDILELIKEPTKAGEFPQLPYLPIDIIPMNSLGLTEFRPNEEAQSSLIKFAKNDILIGAMRVYFHRVSISPCNGITRTTCFVLRPKNKIHLEFALLLCNRNDTIDFAQSTSKGSTMPYAVWDNGLANMPCFIPDVTTVSDFSKRLLPIIEIIRDSMFDNIRLREMRDSLLPQLMSGSLSVNA
jgi:type I restriction enzyme S subunit